MVIIGLKEELIKNKKSRRSSITTTKHEIKTTKNYIDIFRNHRRKSHSNGNYLK